MTFSQVFQPDRWDEIKRNIYSKTPADVRRVLSNYSNCTLDDFMTLLSPAAEPYLEEMAFISQYITRKRFGNTIQMYIPMYLSNECQKICTYCGFSMDNKIKRVTLNSDQIMEEVEVIKSFGYDHVLLLTGEANVSVGVSYFKNVLELIRPHFSNISMEVQPLEQQDYEELMQQGLSTVLVYQETYKKDRYKSYHPKGKKSNFNYRLDTPDRLGKAGIFKIGLGSLIGLEDWRVEAWHVAQHLEYLEKHYWKTKYSISFPRLRPAQGFENLEIHINDKELVQLICAYRIFNENLELSLSTREDETFRNNAVNFGITSMSAGSKTNPGGYAADKESLEQFEINDERNPAEIATMIKSNGYEPVWKDWDRIMDGFPMGMN